MSSNLPIFVWDVQIWNWAGEQYKCPSTSIPYWDSCCGEYFYESTDLESKLDTFMNHDYTPRDYILKNLTSELSAEKLYNHIYN